MTNEFDQGDYVLVPKSKAKISRARKGIIGLMAVGAIAALAGGGTFASFSAATTNDGLFETEGLDLANRLVENPGLFDEEDANYATDLGTLNTALDAAQCLASTDAENHEEASCADLVLSIDTDLTHNFVELENESTTDGDLSLFLKDWSNTPCYDEGTPLTACEESQIVVRKADPSTGLPIAGGCLFPVGVTAVDALCNDLTTPITEAELDDLLTTEKAEITFTKFVDWINNGGGGPADAREIQAGLPWSDDGTDTDSSPDAVNAKDAALDEDERAFIFSHRILEPAACDSVDYTNGYHNVTGVGCQNSLQNLSIDMSLTWYLIPAV